MTMIREVKPGDQIMPEDVSVGILTDVALEGCELSSALIAMLKEGKASSVERAVSEAMRDLFLSVLNYCDNRKEADRHG